MAQEAGLCGVCGFNLRASASGAPATTLPVDPASPGTRVPAIDSDINQGLREAPSTESVQTEPLLLLIAEAYGAAVFANADMRSAVEVLESLRPTMLREKDFYRVWDAIDAQIGIADPVTLQPVLANVRDRYVDHVCNGVVARLQKAFEQDVENGQREWLRTYAEALSAWRLEVCRALIQPDFPLAELESHISGSLPTLTQYLWHEEWLSAYELFVYLAQHAPISDAQRAELVVDAARIQLYLFEKPDQARQLLEHAEELAPDENDVVNGWGEYWLRQDDKDKAKQHFERAVQQWPDKAAGYSNRAELYLQAEDLVAAEDEYQQAMRRDSGNSSGPMGLIRLYGRPQLFDERKYLIPSLMKRAVAVDPHVAYAAYLEVGYAHEQNNLHEEAHQHYDRAIALDPSRVDGYVTKGYAFLETGDYDRAQAAFQHAIDVAPELADGYWGTAQLYERERLWQEALHAYEQSLERRPQWAGKFRAKIREMEWKLGKYSEAEYGEAEADVLDILRSEPKNEQALDALYSFADDYYQKLGKAEAALRIYREMRQIRGEDEEATFQNSIGNVYFYNGDYRAAVDAYTRAIAHDPREAVFRSNLGGAYNAMGNAHYGLSEFREAIACYSKAIEYAPEDPVFHSNLALAWENLQVAGQRLAELEQAISALRQAAELQPEDEDYATRLESLERQRTMVQRYGEVMLTMFPVTTPIAVEVADNLVPKVDSSQDGGRFLYEDIPAMRERVERELGATLPGVRFRSNEALSPNTYRILIEEAPKESGITFLDWRYCPVDPARLEALSVPEHLLIPATDPRTGEPGCWLPDEYSKTMAENGLKLWTETGFLIYHLEMVLRQHLPIFFGMQEAQNVLDRWAQTADEGSSKIAGWNIDTRLGCARLLRTLLDEQVPITARDEILEVIASRQLDGDGVVGAVRDVRLRLRQDLPGNAPEVQRILLPEEIEAAIGGYLQNQEGQISFSVPPMQMHDFLIEIGDLLPTEKRNVALVVRSADLRPFVRRLVAHTFAYLMVLSAEEFVAGDGTPSSVLPS